MRLQVLASIVFLLAGAEAGAQVETSLVQDVRPGPVGSGPWRLGSIGDTLLFIADSDGGQGPEIWATDGNSGWLVHTPADTSMGLPKVLGRVGRDLFLVLGNTLWRTDGVIADTVRMGVDSTRAFPPCAGGYPATALDDRVVFAATPFCDLFAVNADSSWLVASSFGQGAPEGFPHQILRLGDQAFVFWAFTAGTGRSIWRTSGEPGDHVQVLDPEPDTTARAWGPAAAWEGSLYFGSDRGGTGEEMWRWPGSGAPQILADLAPGSASSMPQTPFVAIGRLFFMASEPSTGLELRQWDGSTLTTPFELAAGSGPGPGLTQMGHREAGGALYFWVRNGTTTEDTYALHAWDGTDHRVISTGLADDSFHEAGHVVAAGGRVWFDGCDTAGIHGASLWHTDGVTASVAVAGSPAVCTDERPFMGMSEVDGWLLARMDDPAVGIEPFMVRFVGSVATEGGPGNGLALRVTPNPAPAGAAAVALTMPAAAHVQAQVFDMLGRSVATLADGQLAAGGHALRLPAGLPPGAYLVRAVVAGEAVTVRLTVSR